MSPATRLFLTSASLLFLELLLIRWVPGNVVHVRFFSNIVLLSGFLGMGIGILVGGRVPARTGWLFGPLLLALAVFVLGARTSLTDVTVAELYLGLGADRVIDPSIAVVGVVVLGVAVAMGLLALPIGGLLRSMPPLRAYAFDIGGSLAGITLFAALSAFGTPPALWFAVLGALVVLAGIGIRPVAGRAIAAACVAGVAALTLVDGAAWSPYDKIDVASRYVDEIRVRGQARPYHEELRALHLGGIPTQVMWRAHLTRNSIHDEVYRLFPERTFRRVLVIGSGAGTDVAHALLAGAERVDAVEIDPQIVRLGREHHPDRAYTDPRVRTFIDDGRAYLRRTEERYDLVIYAQPAGLARVARSGTLRLESFLFTREAYASIRDHLQPDGVFVMSVLQPWVMGRAAEDLTSLFGTPAHVRLSDETFVIVAGAPTRALSTTVALAEPGPPVTDDWPFHLLSARSVPPYQLGGLGLFVLFAAAVTLGAVRAVGGGGGLGLASAAHFFFLGAAFLLLETRSLVTFSLLFGTTWVVNALVFFGILASVLAAIAVSARWPSRDPRLLYAGLLLSLVITYVMPPAELLFEPAAIRYIAASAIAFAPVFFANLVFAHSFRGTARADVAFAANLLGAAVGGVLEWSAILVGYRDLAILIGLFYALAAVTSLRRDATVASEPVAV